MHDYIFHDFISALQLVTSCTKKFDSLDLTIQNKILRRMVTFASDKILVIVDVDDKEDSDML